MRKGAIGHMKTRRLVMRGTIYYTLIVHDARGILPPISVAHPVSRRGPFPLATQRNGKYLGTTE